MTNYHSNGLGGTSGSRIATASNIISSGSVYYVSSVSGDAAYDGTSRLYPKALFSQANSLVSDGDIIVLLADHSETIASKVTISDKIFIVGEGSQNGQPTVEFKKGLSSSDIFRINSEDVKFENVKFTSPDSAASGGYLEVDKGGTSFRGCRFEFNGNNNARGVEIANALSCIEFKNCVFVSTGAEGTNIPRPAVEVGSNVSGLILDGCTFDGGLVGFEDSSNNPYAFDATSGGIDSLEIYGLSVLNGTQVALHENTTGLAANVTSSVGGKLVF